MYLNVGVKTIKLLEEYVKEKLQDLVLGKDQKHNP